MKRCAGGFDSQLAVPKRQAVEMGVTVPYVCSVSHYGSDTVTVTLYCIAAVIDYRVAEAARRQGTSGANAARGRVPSQSIAERALSLSVRWCARSAPSGGFVFGDPEHFCFSLANARLASAAH